MKKPRLSKTDWIAAAFRALTRGGPQAIRAEPIARNLGVSKGSFYWHFKDVADLKRAMIDHWQSAATDMVIRGLEERDAAPRARLEQLLQLAASDRDRAYGGDLAEAAIRDWARYEPPVKAALRRIDRRRLDYVAALLRDCGQGREQARINADILYGALGGLKQLSYLEQVNPPAALQQLLDMMLPLETEDIG